MTAEVDIRPALRALLESQRFAALATDDHGQPFASLMAFAATEDLRYLVVLTERTTRKYANLQSNPRVALLIDDRENRGSDTEDAVVVTAIGEALELDPDVGGQGTGRQCGGASPAGRSGFSRVLRSWAGGVVGERRVSTWVGSADDGYVTPDHGVRLTARRSTRRGCVDPPPIAHPRAGIAAPRRTRTLSPRSTSPQWSGARWWCRGLGAGKACSTWEEIGP